MPIRTLVAALVGSAALAAYAAHRSLAHPAVSCPDCGYRQFAGSDPPPRPESWHERPADGQTYCVECGRVFDAEPRAGYLRRRWHAEIADRQEVTELGADGLRVRRTND